MVQNVSTYAFFSFAYYNAPLVTFLDHFLVYPCKLKFVVQCWRPNATSLTSCLSNNLLVPCPYKPQNYWDLSYLPWFKSELTPLDIASSRSFSALSSYCIFNFDRAGILWASLLWKPVTLGKTIRMDHPQRAPSHLRFSRITHPCSISCILGIFQQLAPSPLGYPFWLTHILPHNCGHALNFPKLMMHAKTKNLSVRSHLGMGFYLWNKHNFCIFMHLARSLKSLLVAFPPLSSSTLRLVIILCFGSSLQRWPNELNSICHKKVKTN